MRCQSSTVQWAKGYHAHTNSLRDLYAVAWEKENLGSHFIEGTAKYPFVPLYMSCMLIPVKMRNQYNYRYNQIPPTYQEKTIIDIINHYQNQYIRICLVSVFKHCFLFSKTRSTRKTRKTCLSLLKTRYSY